MTRRATCGIVAVHMKNVTRQITQGPFQGSRLGAAVLFMCGNALFAVLFYYLRLDDILTAALDPASPEKEYLRRGLMGYVLYASFLLSGLTAVLWAAPSFLSSKKRAVRRFSWSDFLLAGLGALFTVLVYIETTVFRDYGVHFYEWNPAAVFLDVNFRRDLGIQPGDLKAALAAIAVILAVEAAWWLAARRLALWRRGLLAWAAGVVTVLGLASGLGLYFSSLEGITVERHEFVEIPPLRPYLLFDRRYRPFIPVRPRLGPEGYPVREKDFPRIGDRKNVVLMVCDGLRADHVSPEKNLTPHLMEFAARPDVIVPARHFSTSHFTEGGLFGLYYGLDAYCYHSFARHKISSWPLEVFKANGYLTAMISGSRLNKYPSDHMAAQNEALIYPRDDDHILEIFRDFLRQRALDGRPYVMVLFFYTPHYPFPAHPENRRFSPNLDELDPGPFAPVNETLMTASRNSYKNSVIQADDYFARVFGLIRDDFEAGRTIFGFTTDHGTELWDHGAFGQGSATFWNEKVWTPFFLGLPGARLSDQARHPAISSHKDFWPTVFDFLEPDPRPAPQTYSHGRSLLAGDAADRRDIFLTGRYFPYAKRLNAMVDPDYKYWFHLTVAGEGRDLERRIFKITDQADRVIPPDRWPDGSARCFDLFEENFWRFLEPAD